MRLKAEFITHEGAEEHITVSTGNASFSGMIRSNRTAGFIIECLKKDVTEYATKLFNHISHIQGEYFPVCIVFCKHFLYNLIDAMEE